MHAVKLLTLFFIVASTVCLVDASFKSWIGHIFCEKPKYFQGPQCVTADESESVYTPWKSFTMGVQTNNPSIHEYANFIWLDSDMLFKADFSRGLKLMATQNFPGNFIFEIRTKRGSVYRYWLQVKRRQGNISTCRLDHSPDDDIKSVKVFAKPKQ